MRILRTPISTDTKPFVGESLGQITSAVLEHEPPLANKVDKAVPKALAEIAARAMAKDPEQRPGDAEVLATLASLREDAC